MIKQYDKEFKENAVRYYNEHEDLNLKRCATNLGIAASTLGDWVKKADINNGEVPTRGSGNYSSDEAKENARLRKELKDTKDALDILHQRRAEPKKP